MKKKYAPERLEDYRVFDEDVLEHTAEQTEIIRQFDTHHDFIDSLGAPSSNESVHYEGYNPLEVFHIPASSRERKGAVIVGLAMSNPLDGGQRFQTAAIASMAPDYDVIAFGNPSGGSFDSGVLSKRHQKEVVKGNARPLVDPVLKYVDAQGYDAVIPYGYSYGAELSAELARYVDNEVPGFITVDSASAKKESALAKGLRFMTTNGPFKGYVDASEMDAFLAAREDSLKPGEFNKGIATLSSLAIGRYIARGQHGEKLAAALEEQPEAIHSGFWAEKSEFGLFDRGRMPSLYEGLAVDFPGRVIGFSMTGQRHAFANHIPTQMAMFAQGLKNTERA